VKFVEVHPEHQPAGPGQHGAYRRVGRRAGEGRLGKALRREVDDDQRIDAGVDPYQPGLLWGDLEIDQLELQTEQVGRSQQAQPDASGHQHSLLECGHEQDGRVVVMGSPE